MKKRLRLVSVTVTPHFVVEDGDNLAPFTFTDDQGRTVPIVAEVQAADWPDYPDTEFKTAVARLEQDHLEAE